MRVFDVKMFERCSGNVVATYVGRAPGHEEAKVECVRRARKAKRITPDEEIALVNKIKHGFEGPIDTALWAFTSEKKIATAP